MPAKITRLTLNYRSCPPQGDGSRPNIASVLQESARKARMLTSDWEPSGESRLISCNRPPRTRDRFRLWYASPMPMSMR